MKKAFLGLLVVLLFAKGFASEADATSFLDDVKKLMNTNLRDVVNCTLPTFSDIELFLYTRKSEDPVLLTSANMQEMDSKKKTVFIIHGWLYSSHQLEMMNLERAYLKRYDYNVIMVNWEKLAWAMYDQAVCKLPHIGRLIGEFLCEAESKIGLNIADVHVVGHSLGGQMSGFVGQSTLEVCGRKLGRITGLDPAGPLFVDTERSQRVDSTDATFVDIVHTNGGVFGYYGNCGRVDFYINCGTKQERCREGDITKDNLSQLPQELALCEHARALHVWAEAVMTDNFKATPCSYCPLICPALFGSKTTIVMGQEGSKTAEGGYYVKTNYKSPYAL